MSSNFLAVTIDSWLKSATKTLTDHKIDSARLDCLVLLRDELQVDKSYLFAHLDDELQIDSAKSLNTKIIKRATGMPLAYVRGFMEFYGRTFLVNENVLVPRPESETMISLLLDLPLPINVRIVDVGSGSGCLGITAALELPNAQVTCVDIDPATLALAEQNSKKLEAETVAFAASDLLSNVTESADILLANLPYVPDNYAINYAAKHEPSLALFAGEDGLDLYRSLFTQLNDREQKPVYVLTESLFEQHTALTAIADTYGFRLHSDKDLIQVFTPL